MVNQIFPFLWIVVNGNDVRLAKRETANVLREIDELLQSHAIRRSLVVRGKQFLFVVHFVDVLPSAARKGLENRRQPDVIQQSVPIHRVFQVVQRLRSDVHAAWISLLREQNGFGNRNSQLRSYGIVKVLVVGRPPKRIIDDVGPLQDGVFQKAAVILHFVRDAVYDDAILRGLAHARTAQL